MGNRFGFRRGFLFYLTACFFVFTASVADSNATVDNFTLLDENSGENLEYALSVPTKASGKAQDKYPLVFVFHGAGENSSDVMNNLRKKGGAQRAVIAVPDRKLPFSYERKNFYNYEKLLNQLIKNYPIDSKKLFLLGISIGTAYSREFARLSPERWAGIFFTAALPPRDVWIQQLPPTFPPIYFFVGEKDRRFKKSIYEEGVALLNERGIDSWLYIDPNAGHEHRPEWNKRIFQWMEQVEKTTRDSVAPKV